MKKRLLKIAAIFVAVVVAIVLILAMLPAKPGVTKANFDRLAIGMSTSEVESIYGGISTKTLIMTDNGRAVFIEIDGPHQQRRHGVDGIAVISFNEKGHIIAKTWENHSLYQKLQRWLPWLPD